MADFLLIQKAALAAKDRAGNKFTIAA